MSAQDAQNEHGAAGIRLSAKDREKLVTDNVALARYWARKHCERYSYADPDDTFSEALDGLMRAAKRYDPAGGAKFSSYASHRIRGRIFDGQRSYNKITHNDVLRPGQVVRSMVVSLLNDTTVASIDEQQGDDDESAHVISSLGSTEPSIEEQFELCEENEALYLKLLELTERERYVLVQYFLVGRTQMDIGADLGLSESRINQIKQKAIECMRRKLGADRRSELFEGFGHVRQDEPRPYTGAEAIICEYLQCRMDRTRIRRELLNSFISVSRAWAIANDVPAEAFMRMGVPRETLKRAGFKVKRDLRK